MAVRVPSFLTPKARTDSNLPNSVHNEDPRSRQELSQDNLPLHVQSQEVISDETQTEDGISYGSRSDVESEMTPSQALDLENNQSSSMNSSSTNIEVSSYDQQPQFIQTQPEDVVSEALQGEFTRQAYSQGVQLIDLTSEEPVVSTISPSSVSATTHSQITQSQISKSDGIPPDGLSTQKGGSATQNPNFLSNEIIDSVQTENIGYEGVRDNHLSVEDSRVGSQSSD